MLRNINIDRLRLKILVIAGLSLFAFKAKAQEIIKLYHDTIPNNKPQIELTDKTFESGAIIKEVIRPTLEVYLPEKDKATGTAVIICPGGAYKVIVYEGEGINTAKSFAAHGIAAFVLKYRLPNNQFQRNPSIAPLQDAQQAIKLVREHANQWDLNPQKIGIMGFSAGGHLAATEATHFLKPYIQNPDHISLRPDFQILIYPVISMEDSLTHFDSRDNLLGKQPSKTIIDDFSNELQVKINTPPAYIAHAADDTLVDVDNSIQYFEELRHHQIDVELNVYPKGGHGFIFKHPGWMDPLFRWMENSGWINKPLNTVQEH